MAFSWFLAPMGLGRLYRTALLAPFGGDRGLLSRASTRLYAAPPALSIGDPATARTLCLAFIPAGERRERLLREATAPLAPGGLVILVDHNAPRRRAARWLAAAYVALGGPLVAGSPSRRLRHPAARELQNLGLEVVALRLLAGELFQAVLARRPATAPSPDRRSPGSPAGASGRTSARRA